MGSSNLKGRSHQYSMSNLISLLAALQFLTVMPAVIRRPFTPRELGSAVAWYPAAGLILGAFLWAIHETLILLLPGGPASALTLAAWIILTRALHFDGFLDACDGLFGGFTPERRLEIMRDARVGAFAVAGGGLLILLKFSALQALPSPGVALILVPILGRWTISLLVVRFPYGRQEGMGRVIKDNARVQHLALAAFVTVACAALLTGAAGLIVVLLATASTYLIAPYLLRLIPGLTGDTYGAMCELTELFVLLYFVAIGG